MARRKEYLYKVYDEAGTYVGIWDDVISEFSQTEEINTASSQVSVVLGRPFEDFGEGVDVAHDYQVKIYCIDDDAPNGTLVFQGFIIDYTPSLAGDEVSVSVIGYGARLDQYPLEESIASDPFLDTMTTMVTHESLSYMGIDSWAAQSFYMSGGTTITKLVTDINWDYDLAPVPPDDEGTLMCAIYTNDGGKPGSIIGSWVNQGVDGSFDFSAVLPEVNVGFKYWAVFKAPDASAYGWVPTESTGDYDRANDQYRSLDEGATWSKYSAGGANGINNDIPLKIWNNALDTTITYASTDPGAILRDIADKAALQGSPLTYDATTIELTGTTVTYTFNSQSIWEGMKKCIELAPAGWYFYIDHATNMIHFHARATEPEITFVVGKEITEFKPQKRTNDIINTIDFTGGGDPNLYLRMEDTNSVRTRGRRVKRYIDKRVTVTATAQTIMRALLDQLVPGEIRVNPLVIVDNSVDSTKGRDIEAIILGQMIAARNVEGRGTSLYDVSYYDQDYYDFNMYDISSIVVQIVRLERAADQVTIYCSTLPPDVSKRIEDINRNLESNQTFDNPTVPEITT
jgi:hypothetical protein